MNGVARRWWRVVPAVFITYSLAYLDRANFGLAAASGMAAQLRLTPAMLAWVGAVFSLGYFLFQMPGTLYAQRRSVKRVVFWSLVLWGGCCVLTGLARSFPGLLVIRFLLGVVESAVFPALLIHLTHWFSRKERSRANALLILGNPLTVLWMSIVSGYLIHLFDWRGMFIVEGVPSILWGFVWLLISRDHPHEAAWLPEDEKRQLEEAHRREQEAVKPVANLMAALKSGPVILLCLQFFCWTWGVFAFVIWLPSILRSGSRLSIVETGWLASVPYLAAVAAMIVVSYISDRTQNRKKCVAIALAISAVALCGSCAAASHHFWLSYALLVVAGAAMYAPYGPFWAIVPEILPKSVAGGAMGVINSAGAFGSGIGTFVVGYLNGTVGPTGSIAVLGGMLILGAILTLFV